MRNDAQLNGAESPRRRAHAQAATSEPDVDQLYTPTFDTDDILAWVADETKTDPLDGPTPTVEHFELVGNKRPISKQAEDLRLIAAIVETYRIRKRARLIGTIDVTVPVSQLVSVTVFNHLLVRETVTASVRSTIIAAFEQYDWTNTPDALTYARDKMAAQGVTRDMFAVRQSFQLAKNNQPNSRKLSTEQRDSLLALYGQSTPPKDSHGNPLMYPQNKTVANSTFDMAGPDPALPEKLKEDGYRLDLMNTKAVGRMPTKTPDPVHELIGKSGHTPNVIDIINKETTGLDCIMKQQNPVTTRIATVFAYPEFKVTWELFNIRLGCVTVVLSLPVLWFRLGLIVLWGYIGTPTNILQYMIKEVEGCVVHAVLTGALIGIVLSNFAAALATFRVVFVECVKSIPENVARCLVPGLVLLAEPDGDFKRVY